MIAGKIEGRVEREAIGIEKGKIEAAVAIARTVLADGIDIQAVAKATGLDVAELEKYSQY